MTITVSVSEFRKHLASYFAQVSRGVKIIVKDDKKNIEFAEVTPKQTFNKESYLKTIARLGEVFTEERHPEWATRKKVENWLRKTRTQSDRRLDI